MTDSSELSKPPNAEADGQMRTTVVRRSPRLLADAIRLGRCPSDRVFDQFLMPDLEAASQQYWTPLAVAVRAAQWLDEFGVRSVFDVGSGAGKFCVVAALASQARFIGIEQRARLVAAAGELARIFGVDDRVKFVHGMFERSLSAHADAYYFYNSFGENLFDVDNRLDEDVDLGADRYRDDVLTAECVLREAPIGTYLLTYNGFGGVVPAGYSEVRVDRELPCVLRMWRKDQSSTRPDLTVKSVAGSPRESSNPRPALE